MKNDSWSEKRRARRTSRSQQRVKRWGRNRGGRTRGWGKHEEKPGEVAISRRTKKTEVVTGDHSKHDF